MKNKILACLVIVSVVLGGFFAMYLKKEAVPPEPRVPNVPRAPESLRIGILGESRSDGSNDLSFNQEILTKLFDVLNKLDVRVIFFTGNLTLGWSKPQGVASENIQQMNNNYYKDSGNDWIAKGFLYDPIIFRSQLRQFYTLINSSFSDSIAFYPMMGSHEAIGPHTSEIFQDELKIKNTISSAKDQLGYTVSIGNAFFAIIPTNYYDNKKQRIVEHAITPETMTWLKTVLREAKLNHRYLFVMGHEPAYSTPSIFNKSSGLDSYPEQRDIFWNVLKEYGVLAYFSSHEHVYDRSNRDGIWQIISGGGGSPLNEEGEDNHAFFHCLLLTIPQKENGVPSVTVLDKDGKIRDHFELDPEKQPLHQFRISAAERT